MMPSTPFALLCAVAAMVAPVHGQCGSITQETAACWTGTNSNANAMTEPDAHANAATRQYAGQLCDTCGMSTSPGTLVAGGSTMIDDPSSTSNYACAGRSMDLCAGDACEDIPGTSCNCACGFSTAFSLHYCLPCCPPGDLDADGIPDWKTPRAGAVWDGACPVATATASEAKTSAGATNNNPTALAVATAMLAVTAAVVV